MTMHLRATRQLVPRLRAHNIASYRNIHVSRIAFSANTPASGPGSSLSAAEGGSGTNNAGATEGGDRASDKSSDSGTSSPRNNTPSPDEFPFSPKGPKRRSFRRRPPAAPPMTATTAASKCRQGGAWWTVAGQASGGNHHGSSGSTPSLRDVNNGYVPVIPEAFLKSHYISSEAIQQNLQSIPYHIHRGIKQEVVQTMASCLLAPHPPQTFIRRLPAKHNNIILSSPAQGSSKMLQSLTMAAAKQIGADVLTIDVLDIMELTSDICHGRKAASLWPTDYLLRGFNPYSMDVTLPAQSTLRGIVTLNDDDTIEDIMLKMRQEEEEEDEEEGFDDLDDEDEDDDDIPSRRYYVRDPSSSGHHHSRHHNSPSPGSTTLSIKDKFNRFWTALLVATPPGQTSATQEIAKPKVLYLEDIADIVHTSAGAILLPSLMDAVMTVREAGHNVMVVAGHSPSVLKVKDSSSSSNRFARGGTNEGMEGGAPAGTKEDVKAPSINVLTVRPGLGGSLDDVIQSSSKSGGSGGRHNELLAALEGLILDQFPGPTPTFHHISVPPYLPLPLAATGTEAEQSVALTNEALFESDQAERIREINVRNLQAVLRFRGGVDLEMPHRAVAIFGNLRGIDREVWGFGKVYRLISIALGSLYLEQRKHSGGKGGMSALTEMAATSEDERIQKAFVSAMEIHKANMDLRYALANKAKQVATQNENKYLVRPRDCTRHERRLLGCIVDPDKIKTTFSNTIIPADTIQALQTMITLPLIRPDIFSQGLLKNEFLPGMLLFGPPGTGKTLLAKAVARESGARMLEIKASDVFDMYVGEGEKNVAAVFSLARKLAPCVIFLDEVDSIFRARGSSPSLGGGGSHASQREILNQFMVEWDGIRSSGQNQGIVVMASTNRPYELDDAVLRRLPRRILVDLPDEKAREQILGVYLRQEQLDGSVDIQDLAKRTKLFSGSDLKNLCVSAVLAAVRESVEEQAARAQQQLEMEAKSEDVLSTAAIPPLERIGLSDSPDRKTLNLAPLLHMYRREKMQSGMGSNSGAPATSRVLTKAHFDKAFQQISPSCSEDMSSLMELRKWDGLYGDGGRQRRKVLKTLGFAVEGEGSTTTSEAGGRS